MVVNLWLLFAKTMFFDRQNTEQTNGKHNLANAKVRILLQTCKPADTTARANAS
jgi:hypothetical protein